MSITIEEYGYVFPYKKIKIPFRERRDKVRWPENKILAVSIYVAQEWWGKELLPGDKKALSIASLSQEEGYNFDVGVWRALDLLDKYELKASFLMSGAGAKNYPEVLREIKQRGHEIAAHGYYQSRDGASMDPKEEKEDIVKSTAILESICGERPRGWINPRAECSERTFELLVEEGYAWHGDLRDDDLPYGIRVKDKILIEIPHRTMTTNDFAWFSRTLQTPIKAQRSCREVEEFFQDTFDRYYETANLEAAQCLTFGIHPFMSCVPDRIRAIERMIAYMKGFPGVWFANYRTLAQWWREKYV